MLPIALTCPVWWVARWAARMFASLAVVVACSFGAAALPSGVAAAPAPAVAVPAYPAVGASAAARPEADRVAEWHARPAGGPAPAARVAVPGDPQPVPAGRTAAPAGPRAPPAR
ncbi:MULTISPECIES: hypothetical protein [unclassified Micromonospora]|uniref:hypothetical protein n=1 Tax=unclassified Micromonospora TaxID=2617518 RepID=UPI0033E6F2DE